MFRLPKADEEYLYFTQAGETDERHRTYIPRNEEAQYRLNEANGTLTASVANAGKYFLIGNPFMTYMDIPSFLNVNSDKITRKFWMVTEQGQIAGSVSEDGKIIVAGSDSASSWSESESDSGADETYDASALAPMQGFFVEAQEAAEELELAYTPAMMRRLNTDGSGKILSHTTRSSMNSGRSHNDRRGIDSDNGHDNMVSNEPSLLITASNNGKFSSAARVITTEDKSSPDVAAMDNR